MPNQRSKRILARSCEARQGPISEGIDREPSLRILRLINEVPVCSPSMGPLEGRTAAAYAFPMFHFPFAKRGGLQGKLLLLAKLSRER